MARLGRPELPREVQALVAVIPSELDDDAVGAWPCPESVIFPESVTSMDSNRPWRICDDRDESAAATAVSH